MRQTKKQQFQEILDLPHVTEQPQNLLEAVIETPINEVTTTEVFLNVEVEKCCKWVEADPTQAIATSDGKLTIDIRRLFGKGIRLSGYMPRKGSF